MREVFLCDGVRTPVGRYGGSLASVRPDDLAALVLAKLLERNPSLDPMAIEDVVMGCVNQSGEDNRNVARMGALLAGYPVEVPGTTVNRLCGSGVEAIGIAARAIAGNAIEVALGGGVESMSRAPFVIAKAETPYSRTLDIHDSTIGWRFVNPRMKEMHGIESMPETAENVAADHGVTREAADAFALRSQERAAQAQQRGYFGEEIVAVPVASRSGTTLVDRDEHPRATSLDALGKLKPIVRPGGTVTAGNSSGVNDAAAVLMLASERAVEQHGLKPRARFLGIATAGVEPRRMGIGPAPATRKVLAKAGKRLGDIDVIELNEAFASQALGVLRELGLPDDAAHVNPNGGAIALGHPLGASGVRLTLAAINQLQRTGGRLAVVTMCIGVGQGIAMLIERI